MGWYGGPIQDLKYWLREEKNCSTRLRVDGGCVGGGLVVGFVGQSAISNTAVAALVTVLSFIWCIAAISFQGSPHKRLAAQSYPEAPPVFAPVLAWLFLLPCVEPGRKRRLRSCRFHKQKNATGPERLKDVAEKFRGSRQAEPVHGVDGHHDWRGCRDPSTETGRVSGKTLSVTQRYGLGREGACVGIPGKAGIMYVLRSPVMGSYLQIGNFPPGMCFQAPAP